MDCVADNEFIVNASCAVRAVRGQFGILEVNETIVKNMTDVRLNVQFFYKFGTIYRPYLIDFTVDICGYCISLVDFVFEETNFVCKCF